jgi:hypothetical protein
MTSGIPDRLPGWSDVPKTGPEPGVLLQMDMKFPGMFLLGAINLPELPEIRNM